MYHLLSIHQLLDTYNSKKEGITTLYLH